MPRSHRGNHGSPRLPLRRPSPLKWLARGTSHPLHFSRQQSAHRCAQQRPITPSSERGPPRSLGVRGNIRPDRGAVDPRRMRSGEMEVDLNRGACFRLSARVSNRWGDKSWGQSCHLKADPVARRPRGVLSVPSLWRAAFDATIALPIARSPAPLRCTSCRGRYYEDRRICQSDAMLRERERRRTKSGISLCRTARCRTEGILPIRMRDEASPRSGRRAVHTRGSSSAPKRRPATPPRAVTFGPKGRNSHRMNWRIICDDPDELESGTVTHDIQVARSSEGVCQNLLPVSRRGQLRESSVAVFGAAQASFQSKSPLFPLLEWMCTNAGLHGGRASQLAATERKGNPSPDSGPYQSAWCQPRLPFNRDLCCP